MELLPVIRQLLYLEDCMIIPGLGGFTSRYHPARIVAETGTFIPPSREIIFVPDLKQNDGLLQNRIASDKGITQEEARQLIEDFTVELSHKARSGEKAIIDGIGYFFSDETGQLQFRMDPGINLLLDSFGLSPVHFHQLAPVGPRESVRPLPGGRSPAVKAHEKRSAARQVFPDNHPLRKVMVAIPLLLLLALFPNNTQVNRLLKPNAASFAPEPSLFLLKYPDSQLKEKAREIVYPMNSDSIIPVATSVPATVTDVPEPVEPVVAQPETRNYPLVAGSFMYESNALRYAEELKRKGYSSTGVSAVGGYHRVSIGSFNSIEEAQNKLNQIYRTDPAIRLWIQK